MTTHKGPIKVILAEKIVVENLQTTAPPNKIERLKQTVKKVERKARITIMCQ